MREILLTSSVLILGLLILRRAFREKISRRVQYALWALVLVRLLTPVSLPPLDISVLTMAEPARETIAARLEAPAVPAAGLTSSASGGEEPAVSGAKPVESQAGLPAKGTGAASAKEWTLTEILGAVWLAGAAGMALWLVWSNLAFAARLRRYRMGMEVPGCKYPVYMMESRLDSPCLFGILRPAVYLTPAAIRSEESLRHVLTHEETHARHLDPLWSLLRSVCLVVYWFDPLVWIAVSASRTDCELACDEGVVRTLGEEERLAYGRTLLSLIPVRRLPVNPLLSVTPLSSDKKRLRERIARIAENRKTRKLALCAMSLLTAAVCVFTFAGCVEQAGRAAVPPSVPDAAPISSVSEEGGPLLTIPLEDQESHMPYRPHLKNVHTRDCAELLTGPGQSWELDGHRIQGYRSIDGYDYVAEVLSSDPDPWKAVCVATVWDDNFTIVPFDELFGWSGFSIHEAEYQTYYGFGEDGIINDLMHVPGPNVEEQIVDLDGNGINELVCTNERKSAYICFQRDGIILSEDVALCMKEAMPERSGSEFLFAGFDPDARCLIMEESLPSQAENGGSHETAAWDIYFDGESLLVYERSSDAAASPNGILEPDPGQTVQDAWDAIRDDGFLTLTLRTADGVGGGTCPNLGYNRPRDLMSDYTWEALTEPPPNPRETSILTVSAGDISLTFCEAPRLVLCMTGTESSWYRVTYTGQEDPFACEMFAWFRRWYDEAETGAMRAAIPAIPDDGRSREEIAREWVEASEGTHLNVTSGSKCKWTYMDIQNVDTHYWDDVDMTEFLTEYREARGAQDVFIFNYTAVFVPEGDPHWFMAGNTGEYEGTDAPEGALQWWMCGYMYLLEDGWHCDGVGTGP
jgi:beta-lactamase regulating signal transducer with metallopeptidase domain